jgi:hypothetical protein
MKQAVIISTICLRFRPDACAKSASRKVCQFVGPTSNGMAKVEEEIQELKQPFWQIGVRSGAVRIASQSLISHGANSTRNRVEGATDRSSPDSIDWRRTAIAGETATSILADQTKLEPNQKNANAQR